MDSIRRCFGSAQAAALGVNLITFSVGGAFTWSSPVGPKLSSNDSTINPLPRPTSTFEDSLLASIILMGALAGTLGGGVFSEKIGKKKTLMIFGILILVSHTMCAFAANIHVFLAARFLIGVSVGSVFSVVPIYVSEIAKDENRGSLGCLLGVMAALGQLFIYTIGPFVSIQNFSFINLIPPVLFYVYAFWFLPESPFDLMKGNKDSEAEKVLLNLRGTEHCSDIKKELFVLTDTLNSNQEEKGSICDLFKDSILRKSLFITSTIMLIQQFSGICAILSFMQTIFESSGVQIPSAYIVIAISIIALVSNYACSLILDRMGRKLSLLISLVMCFFSLSTLGSFFYLKSTNLQIVAYISWLPILCLVLFIVFFNLGLANVPWVLIGDLFPPKYKALASTVTAFSCFMFGSIVSFCFPFFCEFLGEAGTFLIFGGVTVSGAIFVALVLPETKGKTFLEIQTTLMGFQKQ